MEYSEYSEVKNRLMKSRIELSEARKSAAISKVELAGKLSTEIEEEWLAIRKKMSEVSDNEFGRAVTTEAVKIGEEKMAGLIDEADALIAKSNRYNLRKV